MSEKAAAGRAADRPDGITESYPGKQFGLPEDGPRSVAGVGRRLGALIIDWLACDVIILLVAHSRVQSQLGTLVLFAVMTWLLTGLSGYTLGKRLLSIRVARIDGKPVGLLASAVRTILLLLVVPPLVLDRDLRGLHDKAARTVVLRA